MIRNDKGNYVHHFLSQKSKDEITEVGHHSTWISAFLNLEEGELIFVEGGVSFQHKLYQRARGWLRVSERYLETIITGPTYNENSLVVHGRLEKVTPSEMKKLKLSIEGYQIC